MGQGPGRPMEISAQRKVYMVKGGQIDFFMVKMHTSLMGLSSQAPGRGPACPGSGSAPASDVMNMNREAKQLILGFKNWSYEF